MAQKAALFYFIPNWFDTSCSIVKSTTLPTGTASFTCCSLRARSMSDSSTRSGTIPCGLMPLRTTESRFGGFDLGIVAGCYRKRCRRVGIISFFLVFQSSIRTNQGMQLTDHLALMPKSLCASFTKLKSATSFGTTWRVTLASFIAASITACRPSAGIFPSPLKTRTTESLG